MSKVCTSQLLIAAITLGISSLTFAATSVEVHSDPNCGCCSAWVSHLEANGFDVDHRRHGYVRNVKIEQGITPALASCHTALVDGYVIEGHVPASDLKKLLEKRPDIAGLAVPGMPHGSPGMETGRVDRYEVLAWTRDSESARVFSRY